VAAVAELGSLGLSLLRNRGLAAKDILLDLARRCFRQLGYEANFLRRLEGRQMITSVIAQLGVRRGRACCWLERPSGSSLPAALIAIYWHF
jgi:hypothetical protein